MTTQPEALRLADKMSSHNLIGATALKKTADELRRLHESNQELLAALCEVVAYCAEHGHDWMCMVQARAAINKSERTTT